MATKTSDELPEQVAEFGRTIAGRTDDAQIISTAKKLIRSNSDFMAPELTKMWKILEKRRAGDDDLWIWVFVAAAARASNLPPFHHYTGSKRNELANKLGDLANRLTTEILTNGLDEHVIFLDGINCTGIYIYEQFSASKQAEIDNAAVDKIPVSTLISAVAEHAVKRIHAEPVPGKAGRNAEAVRFIRLIAGRNKELYGKSLNYLIAIATNAIYGTDYTEAAVIELIGPTLDAVANGDKEEGE